MKLAGDNGAIKHFLLDVEVKQRSRYTLRNYRHSLGILSSMLEKVSGITELEDITVMHLRQLVQNLMTSPAPLGKGYRRPSSGSILSITSIRNHVRAWKAFFGWCIREDLIDKNPCVRLSPPTSEKRLVVAFKDEHIKKMLDSCDTSTEMGFRDYLILLLLLDTGIRVAEISTLNLEDVQFSDAHAYIKVFGKGRKEREVGVHPNVSKLLWKYINKHRHPKNSDEQSLFLGYGRADGLALGESGVKQLLARFKKALGFTDVRLSAHTFRHTFSKMYLEQGGDVFKLSRELGHSDIQTTKKYLEDFNSTEARKDHTSFSPINRLNLNKQNGKKKSQK